MAALRGDVVEKVVIGNAELWLGDCFDLMAGMPDGTVDHVVTDVPYHPSTHLRARTKRKPLNEAYIDFAPLTDEQFQQLFIEFLRVSRRWVVSTCDFLHVPLLYSLPEFVRQGVWVKPNCAPQYSGDRPAQGYEVVVILHPKGRKRWNGGGKPAVWLYPIVQQGVYPTEKPVFLLDRIIADFTDLNDTVFDPCMGSGTTGVAAVRQDRRFIGCDIRRLAFDIACERIEAAQAQLRLAL